MQVPQCGIFPVKWWVIAASRAFAQSVLESYRCVLMIAGACW
ncbi:hypothetical protein [Bartonella sp. ML69XJBT]|nr:hypothetical protein [Bartonella sp. ML69XJBT]